MKTYDPRKPLISLHIPKCAGSSFSKILETWFKEGYFGHYIDEKQNQLPEKQMLYFGLFRKKLRPRLCIHGHFNNDRGCGVHNYYPNADQLISIIRDPFDLHLSNYFYVLKLAKEQNGKVFLKGKIHPIIKYGWDVKDYLRERKKSYICKYLPPDITINNFKQIIKDKFIYIGTTENLQNSVDILANKLSFNSIAVPRANVSEWSEKIPANARIEFEENNPLEIEIYNYIKTKWGNDILTQQNTSKDADTSQN